MLVAVDGSKESLRALNYASYLFGETMPVRIILLNVIEWTDDSDGSLDEAMSDEMVQEGRKMLRSVMVPKFHKFESRKVRGSCKKDRRNRGQPQRRHDTHGNQRSGR